MPTTKEPTTTTQTSTSAPKTKGKRAGSNATNTVTPTPAPTPRKQPMPKAPKTGGEEAGTFSMAEGPKPRKPRMKSDGKESVAPVDEGTGLSTTEGHKTKKGSAENKVAMPTGKTSSRRVRPKPSIFNADGETRASVTEGARPRRTGTGKGGKETATPTSPMGDTESGFFEAIDHKPKTKPKSKGRKKPAAPVHVNPLRSAKFMSTASNVDVEEAGTSTAEDSRPSEKTKEKHEVKKASTSEPKQKKITSKRRKPATPSSGPDGADAATSEEQISAKGKSAATSSKKTVKAPRKSTHILRKQQDPYKMGVNQDYLILTNPPPRHRGESNKAWSVRMARISLRNQHGQIVPFSEGGGYCVAMNKGSLDVIPRLLQDGAQPPPKRTRHEAPPAQARANPIGVGLRTRSRGMSVASKSTSGSVKVKAGTKRKARKALVPVIEEEEGGAARASPAPATKKRKANPPVVKTSEPNRKAKSTNITDKKTSHESGRKIAKAKETTKEVLLSREGGYNPIAEELEIRDDEYNTRVGQLPSQIAGGIAGDKSERAGDESQGYGRGGANNSVRDGDDGHHLEPKLQL